MGQDEQESKPYDPGAVVPSLKVGAACGAAGLIFGGVSGVLHTKHPVVRSLATGAHWSAFGTSFWFLRSNILRIQFDNNSSKNERAYASTVSGAIAGGSLSRAMHGRFIPGLVVFSLVGFFGQRTYDFVDNWQLNREENPKPLTQRILESKYMPLRKLSDEQYKEMLNEKILKIDVEIALIDDQIEGLKKANLQEKGKGER